MGTNTPHTWLANLRSGDLRSLEALYDQAFPMVAAHIHQNKGSTDEARDIFQEALVVLLQSAQRSDFVLTSAPSTFLFAVSRNLWLKRLRQLKREAPWEQEAMHDAPEGEPLDPSLQPEEQSHRILAQVTAHCQRLLKAIFLIQEPMEQLMVRMGWKNRHTADNQKYKCIQQARKAAGA
jgi:DNA-directed RNA polymerase specialized sigma24 family protein